MRSMVSALVVALLVACATAHAADVATRPTDVDRPVVALWDDGIHLAGIKPSPIVVAWADGTILRRARGEALWGRKVTLQTGVISPAQVRQLMDAIGRAGFFTPPLLRGLLYVDGPSQTLLVRDGKRCMVLQHMGRSTKELRDEQRQRHPSASPSPKDYLQFMTMWDATLDAIEAIPVENLRPWANDRPLQHPGGEQPTDDKAQPIVSFYGYPEYRDMHAVDGDGRDYIAIRRIKELTPEQYQTMKKPGALGVERIEKEERHGEWLYVAVSGSIQREVGDGTTSWLSQTQRYKVRLPVDKP